ncbi:unnamed protein product [Didymodactylos carnosus]|uniref:Reverse transcriptase domain-containing protein n=1 Tax=Didymodactylos carnosus TaxID=1234261 RepID=A0A8S2R0W1_9BILA|nr:unnamed protein product [Didymodactylos carnosus]
MINTLKSCRSFCLVYLDDIIVFSNSFDEHLDHLNQVFTALRDKQIVLNPPKCEIAVQKINYLGHTITKDTVTPMNDRIKAILEIKEPRTLPQANKFIGALSWYRKFLPHFATLAAPIHTVTNLTKANRHKFKWKEEQRKAFNNLKQILTSQPLFLNFPVDNKPLILTTDASAIGIGGVLQQEVNGQLHNLYYHSQLMTPCEKRYSTKEQEALAIYKCFARMRPFILGRSIIVMTDHCPLCNIMNKTVRNVRVDRIANLIQEYNIDQVIHIKGRENCLPDYLWRHPREQDDELNDIDYGIASKETAPFQLPVAVGAEDQSPSHPNLLSAMTLRPRKNQNQNVRATTTTDNNSPDHYDSDAENDKFSNTQIPSNFTSYHFDVMKLRDEQDKDINIQNIIVNLNKNLQNPSYVIRDSILYKLISPSRYSKTKIEVIYLPELMIKPLLYAIHNDPMTGGHFSTDRTYNKIKTQYWWPRMRYIIVQHIKACILCQQYNYYFFF